MHVRQVSAARARSRAGFVSGAPPRSSPVRSSTGTADPAASAATVAASGACVSSDGRRAVLEHVAQPLGRVAGSSGT